MEYGTGSLRHLWRCDRYVDSKTLEPVTQWSGTVPHKNGDPNYIHVFVKLVNFCSVSMLQSSVYYRIRTVIMNVILGQNFSCESLRSLFNKGFLSNRFLEFLKFFKIFITTNECTINITKVYYATVSLYMLWYILCDINCAFVGYNKNNKICTVHVLNNRGFWNVHTFAKDNGNKTGGHFAGLTFTSSPSQLPKAHQDEFDIQRTVHRDIFL
jgi:hypothetical protein